MTTTYTVDLSSSETSVTGTIVTDGTIGVLSSSNIVDWNLVISTPGYGTVDLTGPSSGNDSEMSVGGNDLTATATGLFFNFQDQTSNALYFDYPNSSTFKTGALDFADMGANPNPNAGGQGGAINIDAVTPFWAIIPAPANDQIGASADQEPPTLMAPSSRTVPAGGSTPMGITASPTDPDDALSVKISGVPLFESITAPSDDTVTSQLVHGGGKGDTLTFTVTAPAGQSISGLTLNSTFPGKGRPVNAFTVTASNSTSGETGTSAPKTITVTDPPASAESGPLANSRSLSDLMSQFGSHGATGASNPLSGGSVGPLTQSMPDIAALTEHFMGAPVVSGGALGLLPSSLATAEEQRPFLASHHG
jgi:hypothetical protein